MARQAPSLLSAFRLVIGGESAFFNMAVLFGVVLSGLTLGVPVAVQLLIDSIANLGSLQPVLILSCVLFVVLLIAGSLVALQNFVLERFERRFYARTAKEITLRTRYADTEALEGSHREDLYNRFFEIDAIKGQVPVLLTTGLNLVLQALVGYVVVAFYHPYFLIVGVVHAALIYLIWRSTDAGAVRGVKGLSNAKYRMGAWLESLALRHRLFKSERGLGWATARTNALTEDYLSAHREHFRYSFTQVLAYQFLMAAGSALLLGIGGWLVVRGQLTVGQLVAAELILGTIFLNMGSFASVLEGWYSLRPAVEKLAQLYLLPPEEPHGTPTLETASWAPTLTFEGAKLRHRQRTLTLSAHFPEASTTLVAPETVSVTEAFCAGATQLQLPTGGALRFGSIDGERLPAGTLRDEVLVVSDTLLLACSIADFLRIGNPALPRSEMMKALAVVGLAEIVEGFPERLDTLLTPSGGPFTTSEALRLKIARAIAYDPKILILTPTCDLLRVERRRAIVKAFKDRNRTLIVLSNRLDLEGFDQYLRLGDGYGQRYDTLEALLDAEHAAHPAGALL